MKQIDGIRDAAEIEAHAPDETAAKSCVRLLEDADANHAERRRNVRKRLLGRGVAADGEDRDAEFDRNEKRQQRDERGETLRASGAVERERRETLERQIKQEAPDDRVDAEQGDPADVQVPIMRLKRQSDHGDGDNDQDRESRLERPIASLERHGDYEQRRGKQNIEPFLDRQAPGYGIEVGVIGGDEEILDVEEIAHKIGGQKVAGHERDHDERDHIGRYGAHPATGEKDAEIAPWPSDHPVDDLRREHETAEDEEDLYARDCEGFRERLKRRVQGQVVGNRDRERRPPAQQIERRAALHLGAV